ncbi:MAG TPA: phospholipase D-like domain-containing protein [Polyangiaceae bacterium]|nr:phospholipase D-like domain-containing protein [Polyangiaceae bacterium]
MLLALLETAQETGHQMRLLHPASRSPDGSEIATFIHSKLLIIDDRLLMAGSPNLTERSIALDTELAVTWECAGVDDGLSGCIRGIRDKLLSEHSGVPVQQFTDGQGLCVRLDTLMQEQTTLAPSRGSRAWRAGSTSG